MQEQAEQFGFSAEEARELTLQTLKGAVLLAEKTGESFSELRKKVTSKGGTTQAALQGFEDQGVKDGIKLGMRNADKRSRELAGE